jgi:undecaprenyl-diphosphatase
MKTLDRVQNKQLGLPEGIKDVDEKLEKLIVHPRNSSLDTYYRIFSTLGKEPTVLSMSTLTAGLLWQRKQYLAAGSMLLAVGGGLALNYLLKFTVKRPRPITVNVLKKKNQSFSFPSSHTNLSLCYYGVLAWLGLRFFKNPVSRTGWLLLMLYLVLMIGTSRVYNKKHHPTDVLGGYLAGSIWLLIVLVSTSLYERKQQKKEQK